MRPARALLRPATVAGVVGSLAILAAVAPAVAQDAESCDAVFETDEGGLAAYWTFEEALGDLFTDSYAGLSAQNHGASPIADGPVGAALSFDGVDDFVTLPGSALDVPTWPTYSISIWLLNDGGGDQSGYGQKAFDKSTWYSDFALFVHPSFGYLSFWSGSPENVWNQVTDVTHDYRDGLWHHAVVVRDGSYGELWVDGLLKDTSTQMGSQDNNQPFLLGYSNHGDDLQRRHWSGLLDEFAVFDRVLAPEEIVALHNRSAAGRNYCDCPPCLHDLNGDGKVDALDLEILMRQWGRPGSADYDRSGAVDGADLGALLAAWGDA